jgi:glycerophosphoryl diester phosphodiesterase
MIQITKLKNLGVLLLILTFSCQSTQTSDDNTLHRLPIKDVNDLYDYFEYQGSNRKLISGHRGGAQKGYPENCIETLDYVLRHTPATFEIDPRLTKDSAIVLMHDATLERTTNGTGKLSDYTLEEVKKLRLKDSEGNLTDYAIPTLEEVIKWAKGKTVVILDKKDVPLEMTAEIIRKNNAESHVMITVHTAEQAKFYYENNPKVMFEAFVRSKEALYSYEKAGIPWSHIMAYVGPENTAEARELCEMLHERGVMCMISAAPKYDKLDSLQRVEAYQEIYNSGVDIIESDRPIEVAAGAAIK